MSRRFEIELEAMPGVDPIQALRHALKALKRGYGMRCVRCVPARAPEETAAKPASKRQGRATAEQ